MKAGDLSMTLCEIHASLGSTTIDGSEIDAALGRVLADLEAVIASGDVTESEGSDLKAYYEATLTEWKIRKQLRSSM